MDEEELQLPTIPQNIIQSRVSRSTFLRPISRKRSTRSDELCNDDALSSSLHTSSDPALFSSDETPDAENYSGAKRRKKKTYAGTWWGERRPRSPAASKGSSSSGSIRRTKKRQFTRNFDSGIFMNSDDGTSSGAEFSSDSSFGNDLMEAQRREEEVAPPRTPVMGSSKLVLRFGSTSPQTPRAIRRPTLQETRDWYVMSIVRRCLDDSKEDVDLSGMELDSLPPDVRELATMVNNEPTSQMHFDSLVARPRLYLSNNSLRQFPTPLLEVRNLRLLSLRQNKLTRLPPGIRNLEKLETLNISGNRLESLPLEVLDLMVNHRLRELLSEPNPWLVCTEQHKQVKASARRPSSFTRSHTVTRGIEVPDDGFRVFLRRLATSEKASPDFDAQEGGHISPQVPSITEMVLRQLVKLNNSKRSLAPLMPDDTPTRILETLEDLHNAQSEGDRKCAWCKRLYVKPAATWTEWWRITLAKHRLGREPDEEGLGNLAHVVPFETAICGGCA